MALDLVVIGKAEYFGCGKIDKEMMIGLDAVFESWGRHAFSLVVTTTGQTSVDVYVRQGNAAYLLEIEIDQMSLYCT